MEIVTIDGIEVGLVTVGELDQRAMNLALGEPVERPDLVWFAATMADAVRLVEGASK